MLCKTVNSDWSVAGVFIYADLRDLSKLWWWNDSFKQWRVMRYPDLLSRIMLASNRVSRLDFLVTTGYHFEEPNEE